MKKICFFILFLLVSTIGFSKDIANDKYRRNSLCLGYIVEGLSSSSEAELVLNALKNYQISDKFNDHSIGWMVINPSEIKLSEEDEAVKIKRHTEPIKLGELWAAGQKSSAENRADDREYTDRFVTTPKKLIKFAKQNHLANYMVAKWFNPSQEKKDGSLFNMDLIQERGAYNASELEKLRSKEAVRGMAILKDAGMDLIPNTYLAFVRLKYMSAQDHYNRTAD